MNHVLKPGLFVLVAFLVISGCFRSNESSTFSSENSNSTTTSTSAASIKPVKEFHLYAGDITQELSQGKTLYSWGYGLWDEKYGKPASPPTIPGPELRVKEGDHVKVIFHNEQKEPHTIHFHGVDNSFAGDGVPGVSQEEVEIGGTFTYEFDANTAGTFFYHCHVEPDRHPEMGLYGAFIVEPKEAKAKYDGEFVMMLGERDPLLSVAEGSEAGEFVGTAAEHEHLNGEYETTDRKPKYFTINGKTDPDIPPLSVEQGKTYLIRLINAGSDVHTIHTHGHHFQVVATDGRDIEKPQTKDSITLGPGERYDLAMTADNPGAFPLHCHIGPHGAHGMHTFIVYKGYEDKIKGHHMQHLGSILHELGEMKQFMFEQKYDQLRAELGELSVNFDKVKDHLATVDAELAKSIEETGTNIATMLTESPNKEKLKLLMDTFEEQLQNMAEKMEE